MRPYIVPTSGAQLHHNTKTACMLARNALRNACTTRLPKPVRTRRVREAISTQTPPSPFCARLLVTMPFTLKNAACGGAEKRANPYATDSASPAKKAATKAPAASSLVPICLAVDDNAFLYSFSFVRSCWKQRLAPIGHNVSQQVLPLTSSFTK